MNKALLFLVFISCTSALCGDMDLSSQGGDASNLGGETIGWNPADWDWWKNTKQSVTDIYDRATHSKISKSLIFVYGVAKEYAVSINNQYDNFMRALNIINRELVFIQNFAVKVESIKNRGWSSNTFWQNMAELESSMNDIESMGADLREFDELVGANRKSFATILNWRPPSFTRAYAIQKAIWGGVPDEMAKDNHYSQRPDVRIINNNAYFFTRTYGTQGSTMKQIYDEAQKGDENNLKIDTLTGSPSNVLAFQNAYLCNDLMNRAIYLGQLRDKVIANCNAINSVGAMEEISDIHKYKTAKSYENQ